MRTRPRAPRAALLRITVACLALTPPAMAGASEAPGVAEPSFWDRVTAGFAEFVEWLGGVVFYEIGGIPLVVWVLVSGAVYYTLRMGFINIRGFRHAVQITRGVYDNPDDPGEISHFQALTSALSATVGLGNIAGVAVAVGTGGPGAVFWMVAIALFGMTAKFVECTLAQMWRKVDADGRVNGGPMYYLSEGLQEIGVGWLGKLFGGFYAVCIIGGAFGGGNMFQANQSYELAASQVPFLAANSWLYGVILAALVGLVILGGIKRIGAATAKIVPFMAILYIGAALVIVLMNLGELPGVISSIIGEAFSAKALFGGTMGALIIGLKRAVFSNEAGIGSAAIAHSAAKTDEPVREGMVAMLGPFIDTVVICLMTASVLLITQQHNEPLKEMRSAMVEVQEATDAKLIAFEGPQADAAEMRLQSAKTTLVSKLRGAELTSAAFKSAFPWFPAVLSIVVFLFAYSTMISWSYYGERGWEYLFGRRTLFIYRLLFLGAVVLGATADLGPVLAFSDIMIFMCAFPNILGGLLLSNRVKRKLDAYWGRYRRGELKRYK